MRLWSLHPKFLDAAGLVALWREALLAKHVLAGKTKGYKHHPQLIRFQNVDSLPAINQYLASVLEEAGKRGYNFNKRKVDLDFKKQVIKVNDKQLEYELEHLKNKLSKRDKVKLREINKMEIIAHPMFKVIKGPIEEWEKI